MKALKEKRISLRSLWRRGLVILSLFALLLAGCGDSDSGDSNVPVSSTLKTVVGYTILKNPDCVSEVQYEGFPIELDGMVVLVRYDDNSTEEVTAESGRLKVYPEYYQNNTATPSNSGIIGRGQLPNGDTYQEYGVVLVNNGNAYPVETDIYTGKSIGGIKFQIATKNVKNVQEMHWTGNLGKKTYYSDDIPDLSGVSLEMRYAGDNHDRLYHKVLPLPKNWAYWHFSERDDKDQPFIQIYLPNNTVSTDTVNPGIPVSTIIPLEAIYYVETVEFDPAPAFTDPIFVFDPYVYDRGVGTTDFYFSDPSVTGPAVRNAFREAWLDRIADAKIKVTYTDGSTRTHSIPEIRTMRDQTNPAKRDSAEYPNGFYVGNGGFGGTTGVGGTATSTGVVPDDAANPVLKLYDVPIHGGNSKANNVDSKKGATVTFMYRGIKMEPLVVPIYGQFIGLEATAKEGQELTYDWSGTGQWPDGKGFDTIRTLAAKLDVNAVWALYTDKNVTTKTSLKFFSGDINGNGLDDATDGYSDNSTPNDITDDTWTAATKPGYNTYVGTRSLTATPLAATTSGGLGSTTVQYKLGCYDLATSFNQVLFTPALTSNVNDAIGITYNPQTPDATATSLKKDATKKFKISYNPVAPQNAGDLNQDGLIKGSGKSATISVTFVNVKEFYY